MITNEDARELVKTLRDIAERNVEERDKYESEYWKGQSDGRNGAYNLAADWVEQLIPNEEKAE